MEIEVQTRECVLCSDEFKACLESKNSRELTAQAVLDALHHALDVNLGIATAGGEHLEREPSSPGSRGRLHMGRSRPCVRPGHGC